jgi:hypothetical protein
MLPVSNEVVIRGALQQVSIAYRNTNYIADQVFPIIDGLNRQTRVAVYPKAAWFGDSADYRAEGTTAKRIDYAITTVNIDPQQIAVGRAVTDELVWASQEPNALPMQPISEAMIFCADKLDLKKERLVAAAVYGNAWADGGGAGGTSLAGAWADATSANPFITNVLAAKGVVQSKTGLVPNTMLVDYKTFLALQNTDPVLQRLKYVMGPTVTTEGLLAQMLQLDNFYVGKALYTTDKEVVPAESDNPTLIPIWDPSTGTKGSAFLFYRPPSAGLRTPSPGYQYRLVQQGAWRRSISYREDDRHQTVYESSEWLDIRQMAANLGYAWKNTISA